jgi:hypothetical protein
MLYLAFRRRKAVEALTQRKIAMTCALHSNSAFYKSREGSTVRDEMVEAIEESTADLIAQVYGAPSASEIEKHMMENDPFIQAIDVDRMIGDKPGSTQQN